MKLTATIKFILVLILLVVMAGGFYFLAKTQGAQWKTYINTKYNYTVDYPSDWTFREYPDSKDGASFYPPGVSNKPDSIPAISISAGRTMLNYASQTLEEYAKIAGTETQNYNKLASIKKVTTVNGTIGYETTWMVQPMTINGVPPTKGDSESLPITYFEIPNDKTSLVRVILDKEEDLVIYEKMITTVKVGASDTDEAR